MWTTVIPSQLELYIDGTHTASVLQAVLQSNGGDIQSVDSTNLGSCVVWTGARARSHRALEALLRSLDAMAARHDGSFYVIPAVGGVWCDPQVLSVPPSGTPGDSGDGMVDVYLTRGLHVGPHTESRALDGRPLQAVFCPATSQARRQPALLLRRSARLALITTMSYIMCTMSSMVGFPVTMSAHVEALLTGLQAEDHPMADLLPPWATSTTNTQQQHSSESERTTRSARRRIADRAALVWASATENDWVP